MIHLTVWRSHNRITAFELSGHAESGPYGYDLVCAGVSAVSFGAVNSVISICGIDLDIEQKQDGGFLHVAIPDNLERKVADNVQLLFEGMLVSMETIERDYHQFIKIEQKQGG
ncbi:ribosomal-processing cysteine protease Prp [Lentibacillus saliphilus]|uniref:ribosomal-processing cysteine protease Prp n=1 Tax=Lentibacillus saliphilus TaxID=2737028 RepID=UPI001C30D579|nr:ribosomal-processing cysteine protease Prp [Lentibacillus saliphilus]